MTTQRHTLTPAMRAEQAGNMTARTTLEAMRLTPDQIDRLTLFIDALIDVYGTPIDAEPESALRGFAVAMLASLDVGLGFS
jgi:hypothetical protein